MRKIYTSAFVVLAAMFISASASAQLGNGLTAPDFTANDINGTSRNLYNYLTSGHATVIDVSATWCPPCWSYHNSGNLENFYIAHGPTGAPSVSGTTTNNGMVLFIEGDPATTNANLNGIGSNTQGNWVTGTLYPIIESDAIAATYQPNGFPNAYSYPAIYMICPNHLAQEVNQLTTAGLYAKVQGCPSYIPNTVNDPAIVPLATADYPKPQDIISCTSFNIKTRIQNLGTAPLTSATVKAYFNNVEIASYNWSGNLAQFELANVTVGQYTPTASGDLKIKVIANNNTNTNNDEYIQKIFFAPSAPQSVMVKITTDAFGSETKWKIKKSNGQVVASGGPYNDLTANGETVQPPVQVNLTSVDCYSFEITDTPNGFNPDGMCCNYGEGKYEVTDLNNNVLLSGAEFTDLDERKFKVELVGVEEEQAIAGIKIFPNPSVGNFNLNLNLTSKADVAISVTNAMGQAVYTESKQSIAAGQHTYTMDLSAYADGIYLVSVNAGDKRYTQLVTIAK